MAKYNFFISYARRDGLSYAMLIREELEKRGYSVWLDVESMGVGDFVSAIKDAIANSDCFLPIMTDYYLTAEWAQHEAQFALKMLEGRAKSIIPIICTDKRPSNGLLMLWQYQGLFVRSQKDISPAVERIDQSVGIEMKSSQLYEKLMEYSKLRHSNKEAEVICQLLVLLCKKWSAILPYDGEKKLGIYQSVLRLYERLEKYVGSYDAESRKTAHSILDALDQVEATLYSSTMQQIHLPASCFAIRLLYLEQEIRTECVDVLSNGDVHNIFTDEKYVEKQRPFVQAYEEARAEQEMCGYVGFPEEEIAFIQETEKYIVGAGTGKTGRAGEKDRFSPAVLSLSEDEEILMSIAKFTQEGNKLFDVLQKRGMAGDFLKCLLTSYERLKNYCEIVGATNVAADCVDRIVEIRDQIARQVDKPAANEKAENGIKSLLGFTLRSSGSYDVFISFKSEDADLAEKVYQLCQRHMKVPFWSKRTLPELSKSEYEDAIYDALRKSKHFVVVLSDLKYLQANWIQREMKAFDRAITEGRKSGGNFVIVATDDVYKEILSCNKMCLDERYCGYQILKMSEYEKTLMQYIS